MVWKHGIVNSRQRNDSSNECFSHNFVKLGIFAQKLLSPLPSQILPKECERRATAPYGMHSQEKPIRRKKHLILVIAQTAIQSPLLHALEHFVAHIFSENLKKGNFGFGNGYFDNDS